MINHWTCFSVSQWFNWIYVKFCHSVKPQQEPIFELIFEKNNGQRMSAALLGSKKFWFCSCSSSQIHDFFILDTISSKMVPVGKDRFLMKFEIFLYKFQLVNRRQWSKGVCCTKPWTFWVQTSFGLAAIHCPKFNYLFYFRHHFVKDGPRQKRTFFDEISRSS